MIHNSQKIPVVFFGASRFVLPIIEFLHKEHDLKLVVTTEIHPTDAVPKYCIEQDIPYVSTTSKEQLLNTKYQILDTKASIAILAYFGLIVTQEIIDIFPKGIVNIHPSLLPKYRGSTPVQTALVLGDVKTGVSVMLLDKEMDHGPILAQEEAEILPQDTAITLYERLFPQGVQLLEVVLPAYLAGELLPKEQEHNKATFTKVLTRDSGFVDITKPISPELLDRMIRAYYPWPGVWTTTSINHRDVRIKFLPNPRHSERSEESKFLIQVEGKKPMSYKDFINGYSEGENILKKLQLI